MLHGTWLIISHVTCFSFLFPSHLRLHHFPKTPALCVFASSAIKIKTLTPEIQFYLMNLRCKSLCIYVHILYVCVRIVLCCLIMAIFNSLFRRSLVSQCDLSRLVVRIWDWEDFDLLSVSLFHKPLFLFCSLAFSSENFDRLVYGFLCVWIHLCGRSWWDFALKWVDWRGFVLN